MLHRCCLPADLPTPAGGVARRKPVTTTHDTAALGHADRVFGTMHDVARYLRAARRRTVRH